MKVWTLGVKVTDTDRELAFLDGIGGRLIIDDVVPFGGATYRAPLVRLGDKYLHVLNSGVYESESALERPLEPGLMHVVYRVDDIGAHTTRALQAGATQLTQQRRVSAGFGTRDVVALRSPGGMIFEYIQVHEDRMPELP
jgi:hypothetical protein